MWTYITSLDSTTRFIIMLLGLISFILLASKVVESKKQIIDDGSIFISYDENGNRTCYLSISLPLDELLKRDHITVKVDSDK